MNVEFLVVGLVVSKFVDYVFQGRWQAENKVVRDIREYKQQKSPIYVKIDEHNILYINGHPICEMEVI